MSTSGFGPSTATSVDELRMRRQDRPEPPVALGLRHTAEARLAHEDRVTAVVVGIGRHDERDGRAWPGASSSERMTDGETSGWSPSATRTASRSDADRLEPEVERA